MFREHNPEWTELAARLRAGHDIEEIEITEAETEQGRRRRLGLIDLWTRAMHRGDRVTATTRVGTMSGTVDFVGKDYATLLSGDVAWDLVIDRVALRTTRSPTGGHSVTGGSRTFVARLAEYEATGEIIEVFAPDLELGITGRVTVGALDHVVIADPVGDIVVPRRAIDAIRREM